MTKNIVLIGLMIALGGCQSMKDLGKSTVEYLEESRTTSTNFFVPLGTFDDTLDGSQGKACRETIHYRPVRPADLQLVMAASEGGIPTCQHVLGTFYESGTGVSQNTARARALYLQAAPSDPYAYLELARMARDGIDEPIDPVKARDYYTRAGIGGVVGLGGLMEQGKGGAQDVSGALKLYVDATQKYGDPAWEAMRPLLARGLELDAEQVQKYNRVWHEGFLRQMRSRLRYSREFRQLNFGDQTWTVNVLFRFSAGSPKPKVYLGKSSGNPEVDIAVVSALYHLTMKDPYMVPAGQETFDITAPFVLSPSAKRG
ncbi:tetratricopeptide repeat protein [Pseudomonas sp. Pdm06]|uniref:tetratricopeptide repeat protein n=1 Tax=Pseudomonas sp. Pdm06 TaxID=1790044 RepID=UPI00177DA697|nr:SEL1-like repeat protein [Pseudomonas sp. Pdm06]MBD9466234.1 sel1 repeat family protein [Pseudomonas sp. Pdm06]